MEAGKFAPSRHLVLRLLQEIQCQLIMLADAKAVSHVCCVRRAQQTQARASERSTRDVTRVAVAPAPLLDRDSTTAQSGNVARAVLFSPIKPVIGRVYLPIASAPHTATALSSSLPLQ